MHLDTSLAVSYVMRLLVSDFVDVGEESREVVVSHVLEGEFPKLLIFVRIIFGMIPGVFVSSAVAKPDIVSPVCKHEAWSFIFIIDDPGIRTIQ